MAEEKANETVKEKGSFDFKIIIIGLVIFLVAMGASYFIMRSLIAPLVPKEEEKETLTGNLVSVGEFTTNINDEGGTRFLKVEVFVEVSDEKVQEEITVFMPVIKDTILGILSSQTVSDLDPINREKLKVKMKKSINAKIGKDLVKGVYFTNFIMQ
ncbi:flagellar basal body-associated FliL family protein [Syntrophomonas palmitatica]|uniref:flagellar basal body-associated FliL family protein n=1 Tax=Syntrophomonas palmitatica TaxID=402877 RepID=UPI0006D10F5C|nr:flagellar basal body-associated FliL family protein [Syntrophomonas palmitatica]